MASVTLEIANTGETIHVEDIDLESVTLNELLEAAIEERVLPTPTRYYACDNKEGKSIGTDEGEKNYFELGFCDGDSIKVVKLPGWQIT